MVALMFTLLDNISYTDRYEIASNMLYCGLLLKFNLIGSASVTIIRHLF